MLPDGEHSNVLEFASLKELQYFMDKDQVRALQVAAQPQVVDESKRGREWLEDVRQPPRWASLLEPGVRVNENVAALEPTVLEE